MTTTARPSSAALYPSLSLPHLTILTPKLIGDITSSGTNAEAKHTIDELFQQKQTEFVRLEGNVLPSLTGFKSLLHELAWVSTYVCVDGCYTDAVPDISFNATLRNQLVDTIKRNLDVDGSVQGSIGQTALVDVLYLIWMELDQFKLSTQKVTVAPVSATPQSVAPPTVTSASPEYTFLRDRFLSFVNGLLSTKKPQSDVADAAIISLLPPRAVRETLQPEFLDVLGIYTAVGMSKQMVTVRTAAWYRQQKFNLLREETEGFAKLFTELTTFFLLPASSVRIDLLITKVQAFIGYFDLDPNRVIDLILDAFERTGLTAATGHLSNFLALIDCFQKENVLQIIGFKFRNYYDQYLQAQMTGAKVATLIGVAPPSLYDIAAVLIKTGRIQTEALYAHLSPSDELMALARSELLAEEKRKLLKMNVVSLSKMKDDEPLIDSKSKKGAPAPLLGGRAGNDQPISSVGANDPKEEISLVLTGIPIASVQLEIEKPTPHVVAPPVPIPATPPQPVKMSIRGTLIPVAAPPPAPVVVAPPPPPAPMIPSHPNQKFNLIAALVNQNAWSYADLLLNHLASLNPAAHPSTGGALVDFIGRMVRPLYVSISAGWRRFAPPKVSTAKPSLSAKESSRSVDAMPDSNDSSHTYFNWCLLTEAQVDETFTTPLPLATYHSALSTLTKVMKYVNIYLCNDATLWCRLCRIVAYIITQEKKQSSTYEPTKLLEDLIGDTLIPSFSLLPSCHGHSEELWSVLKQLPYELRYRLYGHWHSTLYDAYPEMSALKVSVLYRSRYFRKRIAAARVKECSRLLVKFAENNAILVFELLLQQIQSFDNMINPVTESMKLLHPLAFDCVAFVLLQQLSSSKAKLSDDGINETHWLQSLASFAGVFFQRYPDVELTAILQFVLNQLHNDQSFDLLILKDILVGMSNIEIHEEVSEVEMEGRAGGRLIQTETTTIRDKNKNKGRPTRVLLETVLKHHLALPLFVAIAQQKNHIVYKYDSEHIKLTSELYDKCHEALLHITAFIDQTAPTDAQFSSQFCSLEELVTEYHIKPSDAFHLVRRVLKEPNMQRKSIKHEDESMIERKENDADTAMTDAVKAEPVSSPYSGLITVVRTFLPDSVWLSLTPSFYALFWRLSLSHLHVPKSAYDNHIAKLKSLIPPLDSPTTVGTNTTLGVPKTELQKKQSRIEKERINKLIVSLTEERQQQKRDVAAVHNELASEKDSWFDSSITNRVGSMAAFIQFCVLPRVLQSGIDAHYTAKFLSTIRALNTPHFIVLDFYDALFKCVAPLITSSSVNEASRFGRFFKEMLTELHSFAFDEDQFNELVKASPACFKPVGAAADGATVTFAHVSFEVKKFHLRLSKIFARFLSASSGSTKMEMNNALLILCKIGTEWPRTYSQGLKVESLLDVIIAADENKNTALKLMSTRSHAQLQSQKKIWIQDVPVPTKPAVVAASTSTSSNKPAAGASSTKPAQGSNKPAPVKNEKPLGVANSNKPPIAPASKDSAKPAPTNTSSNAASSSSSARGSPSPTPSRRDPSSERERERERDRGDRSKERVVGNKDRNERQERDPKAEQRAQAATDSQRNDRSNGRAGRDRSRERPAVSSTVAPASSSSSSSSSLKEPLLTASGKKLNAGAREFVPSPGKPARDEKPQQQQNDRRDNNTNNDRKQRDRDIRDVRDVREEKEKEKEAPKESHKDAHKEKDSKDSKDRDSSRNDSRRDTPTQHTNDRDRRDHGRGGNSRDLAASVASSASQNDTRSTKQQGRNDPTPSELSRRQSDSRRDDPSNGRDDQRPPKEDSSRDRDRGQDRNRDRPSNISVQSVQRQSSSGSSSAPSPPPNSNSNSSTNPNGGQVDRKRKRDDEPATPSTPATSTPAAAAVSTPTSSSTAASTNDRYQQRNDSRGGGGGDQRQQKRQRGEDREDERDSPHSHQQQRQGGGQQQNQNQQQHHSGGGGGRWEGERGEQRGGYRGRRR